MTPPERIYYQTSYPPEPLLAPPKLRDALTRYANHGVPVGDFLTAVLENDLAQAIGRADHINITLLPHIVAFCYNELPSECWGSKARVAAWLERARKFEKAQAVARAQKPLGEQLRDAGARHASDVSYLLHQNLIDSGAHVERLTKLQYAEADIKGPWRLHVYEADGSGRYTSYWVARVPTSSEEISTETARILARGAIAAGIEVRVTDPGDMLVYHWQSNDVAAYGGNFIEEVWK